MDDANKELDGVIRDVQELKTSLEFTQDKFDEVNTELKEKEAKIKSIEQQIGNSKQESLFTKLDYIENQCRRTNVLIDGIVDVKEKTGINQRLKFKNYY